MTASSLKGLVRKSSAPCLMARTDEGDVTVPCDEHDRRMIALRDFALQVQPVDVREFDVQDQAGRSIRFLRRDVFTGGDETNGLLCHTKPTAR